MSTHGACPSCGSDGPVGRLCEQAVCQRNSYRAIPREYADKLMGRSPGQVNPLIGISIEEYLVVDTIGAGGFGQVLLALQQPIGMKTALKLIHADGALGDRAQMMLDKFEGEARALAALNHPNIVRLLKYGLWQGRPYLVMEFIEGGRSMRSELNPKKSPPLSTVRHVLHEVLNALEGAHELSIAHRDIKPDNILLQRVAGNPYHVKVLDFGLAKFLEEGGDTSVALGTPGYMAPEQLRRVGAGPWTDLYAVGVMAFEMMTGRWPFDGRSTEEVLGNKLDPSYDPCDRLDGLEIPAEAASFFRGALAHAPEQRLRNVASFRAAMDRALAAMAAIRGESMVFATSGPAHTSAVEDHEPETGSSGSKLWWLVAGVFAAIPVMFGVWWMLQQKPADAGAADTGAVAVHGAPVLAMSAEEARKIPAPNGWVVIPPGHFTMGSGPDEPGRFKDESPTRQVTITRPFFMKTTEVTQGEWKRLMDVPPQKFVGCGDDCPMVYVSWWAALEYANKLSIKHGYHECYALRGCAGKAGDHLECKGAVFKGVACNGFRLPTEAEWEYAARAGTATAVYAGAIHPKSPNNVPELDAIAWYAGNSGADYEGAEDCSEWESKAHPSKRCGVHPVGRKQANPWGLYDMIGNVYEWVWDWKAPYPAGPAVDPVGPDEGEERVSRGGNWFPPARKARAARRGQGPTAYRCLGLGFRLVRTVEP